ncbi:hypothetical protein K491DRAFT_676339 [Lophiostoma macrostomum CBS 122681]|uniref:Uncharacterized protein n=1 Tax=Lophiostoma macrostomum CBS 122681 TaxID=1314788 RepID=A0A6A6TEV9_9PLEO|nr:hypothetical protein K491DRAFT_676339 [Lophiostoma macrostomum CBS 122681]
MGRLVRGTKTAESFGNRFTERTLDTRNEQKTKQKYALERLKTNRAAKTATDASEQDFSPDHDERVQPTGVHKNIQETISRYKFKRFQDKLRQKLDRKVDLKAIKVMLFKSKSPKPPFRVVTENNGVVVAKRQLPSEDYDDQQWILIKHERDVARNPFSNNTVIKWRRLDKLNVVRSRMVATYKARHTEFQRLDGSHGVFQWDGYGMNKPSKDGQKLQNVEKFPAIFEDIRFPSKAVTAGLPKRKGTIRPPTLAPPAPSTHASRAAEKSRNKRTHAAAFIHQPVSTSSPVPQKRAKVQHLPPGQPSNRYKLSQAKSCKSPHNPNDSRMKVLAKAPISRNDNKPIVPQRRAAGPSKILQGSLPQKRKGNADTKLRDEAFKQMLTTPAKSMLANKCGDAKFWCQNPRFLNPKIRKVKVSKTN